MCVRIAHQLGREPDCSAIRIHFGNGFASIFKLYAPLARAGFQQINARSFILGGVGLHRLNG